MNIKHGPKIPGQVSGGAGVARILRRVAPSISARPCGERSAALGLSGKGRDLTDWTQRSLLTINDLHVSLGGV